MIELAFPWALLLLPVPWLVWRFAPAHRERVPALRAPFFRRIAAAAGAEARAGSVVLGRPWLEVVAAILAWTLLVVALARPERVGEPIEITRAARDIVLAIDISGSMDEADFLAADGPRVQRLEAVKRVVGEFIEAREGDRVALIIFGDRAFVQAPFTEDLSTVRQLLTQTEVGMAGPSTVIGDAIGLAIRTFEASDIQQRLLLLLSDGADTGSRMSPRNAASIAANDGVQIFTIGVGDPQASGDKQVDQATLKEIAARANGRFFFAGDEGGLADIYARIDEMEPRQVETLSFRPRESLAHWPSALAALAVMATAAWLHWRPMQRVSA